MYHVEKATPHTHSTLSHPAQCIEKKYQRGEGSLHHHPEPNMAGRGNPQCRGGRVSNPWFNNNTIHSKVCTPNPETQSTSLCPLCLPKKFPTVVNSYGYIPVSSNMRMTAELAANSGNNTTQHKSPKVSECVVDHFNSCRLNSVQTVTTTVY